MGGDGPAAGGAVTAEDTYSITTLRPEGGAVGRALAAGDRRAEATVEALLAKMDAGEGWTWRDGEQLWWYPSRLRVLLTFREASSDLPATVRADIRVVTGAVMSPELLALLSDLNVHAAGWWWWLAPDHRDIYCSITCVSEPQTWWWPAVMFDALPYAVTVAESMADVLAEVSHGRVCVEAHPQRGLRPSPDGWILGCRLGPRDLSASLDLWFFDAELARMDRALSLICGPLGHEVFRPLEARVHDELGEPRVLLRRQWHPQHGWGWQLATVTGLVASRAENAAALREVAARLNTEQSLEDPQVNRFGGWSYVEGAGLVHLSFLPASILDQIVHAASTSIGDVAALMLDVRTRLKDGHQAGQVSLPPDVSQEPVGEALLDALSEVGWRAGPVGWSYLDPDGIAPTEPSAGPEPRWADTAPLPLWTVPRHLPICSFGTFNPAGPTVSSLEVALSGDAELPYCLFFVMRHPHAPEVRRLGEARDGEELEELVSDALAETDPEQRLCGAIEWLDIFSMRAAVLDGVRRFAAAQEDADWRGEAQFLLASPLNPWARGAGGSQRAQVTSDGSDPIDGWINALTSPAVIAGQQLFLRSAWEGATEFREGNLDQAERAAQGARAPVYERLNADAEYYRAQDDPDR